VPGDIGDGSGMDAIALRFTMMIVMKFLPELKNVAWVCGAARARFASILQVESKEARQINADQIVSNFLPYIATLLLEIT
jgi:hypothetical protein